jgi:hypothetical protein
MYFFGTGVLIGTLPGANPTPVNFGLIQEATYEEAGTLKSLFGQYRRAVAVGAGTIKTTLKAKSARISGLMVASLFYGVSPVAGQFVTAIGELQTIPGTPYQVTVTNSATYKQDQGVIYALTGLPLTRVASAPATGQYSVNTATGVYTFAAADTTLKVLISYNYTLASPGQNFTIPNPLLGTTISFGANLYGIDPTTGLSATLQLFNVVMAKMSLSTKLEDFALPDFEAECYCNAAQNLGQWSYPDTM